MTYFEEALARAQRRKSPWNLLLPVAGLLVWVPLIVLSFAGIDRIHQLLYPDQALFADRSGLAVLLATLPVLFGTIPIALLAANVLVWLAPPARRALDAEAKPYPGTSFAESQRALIKLGAWCVPAAFALSTFGVLLPW